MLTFDEFKKLDIRVATILVAERVAGSEKLLKLSLDAGDKDIAGVPAAREIVAGIGKSYDPATLVGRQIVVVANLEPRKLLGLESNGMLLAAHGEDGAPILLGVDCPVPPGVAVS